MLPDTPPLLCNPPEPKVPYVKQQRGNSFVAERAAMFGGSITSGTAKATRRASLSAISSSQVAMSLQEEDKNNNHSTVFAPKKCVQRRASTTAMSYLQKGYLDMRSTSLTSSCRTESCSSKSSLDGEGGAVLSKTKCKTKRSPNLQPLRGEQKYKAGEWPGIHERRCILEAVRLRTFA
mmetsp:Transcript_21076/g.40044  ORF Transcript_21076/g.40044 Transcript_21076/m.40044 type:complete len:178 (-) Transcript_21076:20-553(-)|eukprot:scaffold307_cov162-Amphora_coffeaeformis.AAC.4